ncbi:MAG: pseudaminic acid cytidylyltransferase [Crocinitomicaceae bacterium]|nr:pseudaminic acid cytidylyltransferase [Crocinitomicaceae bacterium]
MISQTNKAICIIPARSGSKRIPQKNVKAFCGKPIITYSIETGINSGIFDKVIVSTDSEDIAEISKKNGAEVPELRSAKNSDDQATLTDVLLELEHLYQSYEYIALLLPTSPLIQPTTLQNALTKIIDEEKADTLVAVSRFSFPIQRAFKIHENRLTLREPEYEFTRSQDLESFYHDSGSFYIIRTKAFLKNRSIYGKTTIPYILDEMESQDIDTPSDWKLAELKYLIMHEK